MEEIYKYVSQLANVQRRAIDKLAKDREYSGTQGKLVHYLLANLDEPVYQKKIESVFGLRAATASELINSLEKSGLVKRVPSEQDGRYKEIILTVKAEEYRDDLVHDMDILEDRLKKNIDQDELKLWVKVTCQMLNNLAEDQQ